MHQFLKDNFIMTEDENGKLKCPTCNRYRFMVIDSKTIYDSEKRRMEIYHNQPSVQCVNCGWQATPKAIQFKPVTMKASR